MGKDILLLVSSMTTGGAERVAANLANAWVARGDRVTLLVTYSGRGECHYALSDQVELRFLADLVGRRGRDLLTYLRRVVELRKCIRARRSGPVVSFLTNVNVATILSACGTRMPIIVSEHTYPPTMPLGWLLETSRRLTYPLARRVTMLTSEGLLWLERRIPRAKGAVIPNPVSYPLSVCEPIVAPECTVLLSRKMLLAVGRLSIEKGFDDLLEAFAILAPEHLSWDLVLLGDGPLRATLEARRLALGLEGRVFLPGRAGNVGDWYARADLYVMSSRYEGFPNTLGEAMAYGCAVVSYDCDTGPRDLIRDGEDGLLVRPVGDVMALARALGTLMSDGTLRARMAHRAVEVRQRYSMERVLEMWDELFDSVADS